MRTFLDYYFHFRIFLLRCVSSQESIQIPYFVIVTIAVFFIGTRRLWKNSEKNAVLGGTMKEKKLSMIAFLIEIGYDLMLSNEHNVSTSPGFEGAGLKKKQQ